jgi:hypothetical protein
LYFDFTGAMLLRFVELGLTFIELGFFRSSSVVFKISAWTEGFLLGFVAAGSLDFFVGGVIQPPIYLIL